MIPPAEQILAGYCLFARARGLEPRCNEALLAERLREATVDPSADPAHPPIDFGDPLAVRRWLTLLREHILDAIALGEDAAKRPSERMFSRYELQRRLAGEERVLLAFLDAGERGLPPVPAAPSHP